MNNPSTKNGYVYIMSDGNGYLKVGHSINPKSRLSQVRCGSPSASISFVSPILSNRIEVERKCHKELSKYSTGGEWFDVSYKEAEETVKRVAEEIGLPPEQEGDDEFESKFTEILLLTSGYKLKIEAEKHSGKQAIFSYMEIIAKDGGKDHLNAFLEKRSFDQYLEAIKFFSDCYLKIKESN